MVRKKKRLLPPSSLVVTQSNQLVEARYNLPLAEQRLILTMVARIQPDDEDFKPYCIPIKDFADFMGIDKNSAYRECKKITKTLLTRVIEIKEPGRLLQTGWVSSAEYIEGSGMVNLCFDPLLKPYLIKLKGNFTSLKLEMILGFKSQYTMRIYSLLKQYEGFKDFREIQLDNLRDMLGLAKDQHKEYSNLKVNVLKPVQKELFEKADLFFEMEEIKLGRRVFALRFKIFNRDIPSKISKHSALIDQANSDSENPSELEKLLMLVPLVHRAKKTIKSALDTYYRRNGFDFVKRNVLYTNAKADKSYAGFINNSLKNDWGHDWHLDLEMTNAPKEKSVQQVWEKHGFASMKEYDQHMYDLQMAKYGVKK